jgi:hypothetical protein
LFLSLAKAAVIAQLRKASCLSLLQVTKPTAQPWLNLHHHHHHRVNIEDLFRVVGRNINNTKDLLQASLQTTSRFGNRARE